MREGERMKQQNRKNMSERKNESVGDRESDSREKESRVNVA